MFKPSALITLLLATLLTACGGDSGGSVVGSSSSSSDSSGGTTTVDNGDGTTDSVTTGTTINNPRIGTGSGAGFTAGALDIQSTSLSAGGTTTISANIVDADSGNAKIVSQEYGVVFSSTCAGSDPAKAAFSRAQSIVSSGEVSVTYEAQGCAGTDVISFKLYAVDNGVINTTSALYTATGTLSVLPPEVGAITFVGSSAPAISISTISTPVLPKITEVTFKVLDQTNNPIAEKAVSFTLTNTVGGISLSLSSGVTNQDGEVKAIVLAGTTHAITSVVASTLANDGVTLITTNSQPISVTTTGLPDQKHFDLVADILNPGAYDVSGAEVKVTAFVGDHFGNPVPDGTVVNFMAESGIIEPFCETTGGQCSVKWLSAGYRPGQEHDDKYDSLNKVNETDPIRAGASVFGLTTILAYSVGEPAFTDLNADGIFDSGEPFESYPEAILDDDLLNFYLNGDTTDLDVGSEEFVDFDADNVRDPAPADYRGAICSAAAKGLGHCASLMHVRGSVVISQSDSNDVILELYTRSGNTFTVWDGDLDLNGNNLADDRGSFYVFVTDVNHSVPANGTSVAISGDGYDVTGDSGSVGNTVGMLPTVYTGLSSSFGKLYSVGFSPADSPKKIEISVSGGGNTLKRTLHP